VQVHLHNEAVKVFTRRGHDWTNRFKKAAHDAWHIKASSAVVDGEIVVPAADGTSDFSVLQNELRGSSRRIVLVAFDLLYLNGRDLRKLPLHRRNGSSRRSSPGPTFNSAKASRSRAKICSRTPASWASRAWSRRFATART
jgi:bifunctional non-homologous end joining protein LigD